MAEALNSSKAEPAAVAATSSKAEPAGIAAPASPHVEEVKHARFRLRSLVPVVILLLAAALLLGITSNWNSWVGRQGNQKTDDAYLRADITPLSTRVSGTVTQVAVEDYQQVKTGDLLVQIKDDDYRAQLEQAQAAVGAARAAVERNVKQKAVKGSAIAQSQAGIDAAAG